MNSIFSSDNDSGTISLNSNNIIIVSEDGYRWSPELGSESKSVLPLRVVNNVLNTIMDTNSNETGGDEGGTLNKNIMIVSEDSSEWSQDFLRVNEDQASLAEDPNTALTDENKLQANGVDKLNTNYTVSENTNELSFSNQSPDSADHHNETNDQSAQDKYYNADVLRCRTCLSIVEPDGGFPLHTPEPSGETLKQLLIYLLPQMASTLCGEDVICKQCVTSIKFCVDFIDNCLKVENELLNECEEDQDDEVETKFRPDENTHVSLDHDYMVSQAGRHLKTELMETEDSENAENPGLAFTEQYIFECFRCGKTFDSERALDNHVRSEHEIVKFVQKPPVDHEKVYYKCNACELLFATKSAFNLHVQTSHLETEADSEGTHVCKQCGNQFFYLADLEEHKQRMHGYNCTICPERFTKKQDLDNHLDTHPDLYACELCDMTFKTKKSMTNHVKSHDNPDTIVCDQCGLTFQNVDELVMHLETEDHPSMTILKKFVCEVCEASFLDKKKLNRHRQLYHERSGRYLCTICDKNFSSKTSMDSHYKLKHAEIKPFQCERCGERFARLDYLRRHNSCSDSNQCKKFMKGPRRKFRYTKADGEPIKCKLCGKVFKDVYLLKLHLTTHTNLRRFRCSVCNLTFTTNKNRERHEKIHDDPMSKYRCTVCWKRTQSQEELDNHMLSHEKKYQCHICHESFARVYLLNYHVSEVHADDEDVEKEKQIVFTEGLKEYLVEYA